MGLAVTDWTDIPDTALNAGQPATSATAFAFRDNVVASANAASGAPLWRGEALRLVRTQFIEINSDTSRVTFANIAPNGSLLLLFNRIRSETTTDRFLQMRVSGDGGSNYGDWVRVSINDNWNSNGLHGILEIINAGTEEVFYRSNLSQRFGQSNTGVGGRATGNNTVSSSGGLPIDRVQFEFSFGNILSSGGAEIQLYLPLRVVEHP